MRQFNVKVIPNASKNEIAAQDGDFLKVKIKAPAQRGKANRELVKFLAQEFDVKKSAIDIIKGERGREKIVEISH
ncbi:MAG: DUF167 domain-containing protein [Patescibacteria group bacterium]